MRFDKFTIKSQEALTAAQQIAEQHEHQQIEPEHLLLAIVQQDDGIAKTILKKLGAEPQAVIAKLEEALKKLPKVSGYGAGEVYLSPRCKKILDTADKEAQRLNDDYVSIEHLLVGYCRSP